MPSREPVSLRVWRIAQESVDGAALVRTASQISQIDGAENCITFQSVSGDQISIPIRADSVMKVVGAGKASARMALGIEEVLQTLPVAVTGQVNAPDELVLATRDIRVVGCRPAGQNFPTERVVEESATIADIVKTLSPNDICIALISGGGSALLELPKIPLDDLVTVSQMLSRSGASIEALNTVRRCLSHTKAGGIARMIPADFTGTFVSLIISDVMGDDLAMISSGPTIVDGANASPDPQEALRVLQRFQVDQNVPPSVIDCLNAPIEKTKSPPNAPAFLIGNNQHAVSVAQATARNLGFTVEDSDLSRQGANDDVTVVADQYVDWISTQQGQRAAVCLVRGGEPTVVLCEHPGTGGRNLQLAATVLLKLVTLKLTDLEIEFVAAGTDGEDGTAVAAGGWFNQELIRRLVDDEKETDFLRRCVQGNDCWAFFDRHSALVKTSAEIQTNVCDLHVVAINPTL